MYGRASNKTKWIKEDHCQYEAGTFDVWGQKCVAVRRPPCRARARPRACVFLTRAPRRPMRRLATPATWRLASAVGRRRRRRRRLPRAQVRFGRPAPRNGTARLEPGAVSRPARRPGTGPCCIPRDLLKNSGAVQVLEGPDVRPAECRAPRRGGRVRVPRVLRGPRLEQVLRAQRRAAAHAARRARGAPRARARQHPVRRGARELGRAHDVRPGSHGGRVRRRGRVRAQRHARLLPDRAERRDAAVARGVGVGGRLWILRHRDRLGPGGILVLEEEGKWIRRKQEEDAPWSSR